jgi:hypothetical protein
MTSTRPDKFLCGIEDEPIPGIHFLGLPGGSIYGVMME